eukprot:g47350.t1
MHTTGFQFLDLGGWKMIWARAKRRDCIVLDCANHVNICFTSNWKTCMVRSYLITSVQVEGACTVGEFYDEEAENFSHSSED